MTEEISKQDINDVAVSSTKIRNALQEGDIATANTYLGYSYRLHGTIVSGKGIGKELGYPTANLKVDESYKLIPKKGVYITQTEMDQKRYYGLTSIGTNPTVGGTKKTIETYFMDLNQDLYGNEIPLEFLAHIRGEEHFSSVAMLKEAIKKDEDFARKFLKKHE